MDFRNQHFLRRIAEDDSRETRLMAEVSQRTHADSRTMRIATIIALTYLPANLVLVWESLYTSFSFLARFQCSAPRPRKLCRSEQQLVPRHKNCSQRY
jgi:hypothetical protein